MNPDSTARRWSATRRLLAVILAALMLAGVCTTAAVAAPRSVPAGLAGPAGAGAPSRPVTVSVSAKDWTATPVKVKAGELLRITATGTWTDGSTTSGPNGVAQPWPDNFFNLANLGVCAYCATTKVPNWGALIGYVGDSPPEPGSYASAAVLPQALRVFYAGGNYEAQVLRTGKLWLAKNADAYSGYTADNSGHVTAKITVLPPESAAQIAARARVAALSVSSATPLQQAWNSCAQALWNAATSPQMLAVLLALIPGVPEAEAAVIIIERLTIVAGTLEIFYNVSGGSPKEAIVDSGDVVSELLGKITGISLFGVLGVSGIQCEFAEFRLSGQLIGQLGSLLVKKLLTKPDITASIAGTWKLNRSTVSCAGGFTCYDDPMLLRFTNCTAAKCTMTRLGFIWKKSHPIVLKNGTWRATFTDITATCGTTQVPGNITLKLTVTSYKGGGKSVAKTLGGTYANFVPKNAACKSAGGLVQDLYGGRS
jgi:hypothetical protein